MSMLFRKTVLAPGVYHAPEGRIEVTPQRIAGWVESFRLMKQDGIKIPIPWGHQSKANPIEPITQALQDERNFLHSRYNATYVEDLDIDPKTGALVVAAPPPPGFKVDLATGTLVNERDGTQIAEVSAAICDWKDGKGRVWQDCIRHVALTPLPVAHGTGGFASLGTEPAGSACTHRFTLSKHQFSLDTPLTTPQTTPTAATRAELVEDGLLGPLLRDLEAFGLFMPPETRRENFGERLREALTIWLDEQVNRLILGKVNVLALARGNLARQRLLQERAQNRADRDSPPWFEELLADLANTGISLPRAVPAKFIDQLRMASFVLLHYTHERAPEDDVRELEKEAKRIVRELVDGDKLTPRQAADALVALDAEVTKLKKVEDQPRVFKLPRDEMAEQLVQAEQRRREADRDRDAPLVEESAPGGLGW